MSPRARGVILAGVQVALLLAVDARYLIDRSRYPRAWARVNPADPDLPIRGRYLNLRIEIPTPGGSPERPAGYVALDVEDGRLIGRPADADSGLRTNTRGWTTLAEPVAFYLPEHAPDPTRRPAGEEVWVEVTVPPRGLPRPIRLGVKRDGVLEPLALPALTAPAK